MTSLQPIVLRRLLQFRRRRNLLLTVKGVSVALIVAIVIGLLFATIDARWALSSSSRWIIAVSIYLTIAITVGFLAIGPWLRGRSIAWLANMLEQLEPRMKDRLLAAIELSDDFSKPARNRNVSAQGNNPISQAVLDSNDFRIAVQRSAARRIESIDVSKILPWSLVRLWMWISAIILVGVASLCLVPDLHLGTRLGRILFPMANFGRVSKYAIEIIKPSPANQCFPDEEVVSIQATIRGGTPSFVRLETESIDDRERQSLPMHLEINEIDPSTYQSHWTPPLGRTRYRVVAEDASTAWYELDVRLRPKAESFAIEYCYPSYTRESNTTVEADNGALKAIAGTVAKVSITTNQKIARGEIRLQAADRSLLSTERDSRIPLQHSNDGKLIADIPIDRDASYHVDLVAAETQFTNTYNPKYLILASPDEPPTVRWVSPTDLGLAVQPDQLLDILIAVEDELPLASLVQQIKSGTLDWDDVAVPLDDKAAQKIERNIDLSSLNVIPGERVQTRFVATDRKGQSTTSAILELYISSMSLDPNRQNRMRERVELAKEVEAFHRNLEDQAKSVRSTRNELKKNRDDSELQQRLADSIQEFNNFARHETAQIREKIALALPKVKDSVSATELELMAQVVARIETESLPSIQSEASQLRPGNHTAMDRSSDQIERLVKSTSQLAVNARDFVSHDVLSQVGQDLSVLLRYQQELKSSVGSILPEQYRRRQMLVARQMDDLSELIREQTPVLPSRVGQPANQLAKWLESQSQKIHEVTGKDGRPKPAQELIRDREQMANQIEQELESHQNVGKLDNSLANNLLRARSELHVQAGTASRTIERLEQSIKQLNDPKKSEEIEATIAQQLLPSLEQLAVRRELQQARNDGDNQFIADLGEAYRATQTALQNRRDDPKSTAEKLGKLNTAMKTLESIHELNQAAKTLEQLHTTERWQSSSLEAHFEQPRAWEAFQQQLTQATKSLANVKVPASTVKSLEALRSSEAIERIESKIGPRRTNNSATASASQDIEELQTDLKTQIAALGEVAETARATLAEYTPSVPDLARDAAKKIRDTSDDTKQLAQDLADDKIPDAKPRIEQLKSEIESNEPELKQLREALADVASRQNLMQQSDASVARDADLSVATTHDIQKRIRESIEDIPSGNDNQTKSEQLEQSASTQERSAASLDQIANHFEALKQGQEAGTSADSTMENKAMPSDLEEAAKDVTRTPELDKAHADAERLRRLANLDPKRVLEQLEKELIRNKPMQTELSDISKEAVDDALNTLDYAAQRENELNIALEDSDLEFSMRKKQLQTDLDRVAKKARYIADSLIPRVQSTADQAQSPDSRKDAQRMRDDLMRIVEATNALDSEISIEQVMSSAKELATGLEYFRRGMLRRALALETASKSPTATDVKQLQNQQKEMEARESRFHDEDIRQAFAQERELQQETNQIEKELKVSDKEIDHRKRELLKAEQQLAKLSEQAASQQILKDQKSQLSLAEEGNRRMQAKLQAAKTRQESAKSAREKVQMSELKPLDADNPSAQLSSRTAVAAADAAQAAAEDLQESLGNGKWSEEPHAALNALNDATLDQEGLKNDIENAAKSLARAARHEQRLSNPVQDAMLAQQADQVAAIASGSMQQALDQLASASSEPTPGSASSQPQATSQSTLQSQQSLKSAEHALKEQAASLRSSSNQATTSKDQGGMTNNPSSTPKKNEGLLSPQEMARMLDELDQQLNSPPKEGASQGKATQKSAKSSSKSGKQSKSGDPGEPSDAAADERGQTLSEAAQRLAAEMNQQRQAMESAAKAMPDTGAPDSQSRSETAPGKSSAGIVLPVEIENIEDWGKLRQQSSENTLEGDREQLLPAYRQQIEEYFKILSKRKAP